MKIFRKYKLATLLNVLGLSVALAAFYLFMSQVEYSMFYNKGIADQERIYRMEIMSDLVGDHWSTNCPRPFETIVKGVPHVEQVQSTTCYPNNIKVKVGENTFGISQFTVGKPGFSFFGVKMIVGTSKLMSGTECLLTRSEAERLFGSVDCVGRKFKIEDSDAPAYTVVGVCEDMPDNCLIPNGMLDSYGDDNLENPSEWSYTIYVKLDKTADAKATEAAMYKKIIDENSDESNRKQVEEQLKMRLMPLSKTFFSGAVSNDKGNRNVLYTLIGGSIFMILMALLNLTNFTLSMAPIRIKGINTRKVLGASNASLRLMVIRDNVVLAIPSLLLAAAMVYAFSDNAWCMSLMQGDVSFASHVPLTLVTSLLALLVAVLSAIYPAWYATSFAPALVLKGSFALSTQGRQLRSIMLVVQFIISVVLTVYVLVMQSQTHYIFNADYGFNKDEVLIGYMSNITRDKTTAIRTELEKMPCVESVGFGQSALGDNSTGMRWGRGNGDKRMSFYVIPVDYKYLSTMQLPIVKGRDFKKSDAVGAYIVNEEMMRQYDFLKVDEPIYGSLEGSHDVSNYPIVGVCKNFKLRSMSEGNDGVATAFIIMGPDMERWGNRMNTMMARIPKGQDKLEARRSIEKVLKTFDPDIDLRLRFLNERLENTYRDEFRFISQVKVFALICIFITLIGVFCLTMFETEYRRKEIGIRKVMGSTERQILALFTRRYIAPLAISFIVGAPVAYLMSKRWLEGFVEHTPIHWWLFPLALLLVSTVVLLTVIAQSWRVARSNPIESINTE